MQVPTNIPADVEPFFHRMTVARFMQGDVQAALPNAKADHIGTMMLEGFGAVPIIDHTQQLIGLVTEHDLLTALEQGRRLGDVVAKDIMAPNPYSVRPDTDIGTLMHVMQASNMIHVPVVVAEDKLVGIISRRDILRGYLNSAK